MNEECYFDGTFSYANSAIFKDYNKDFSNFLAVIYEANSTIYLECHMKVMITHDIKTNKMIQ